MEPKTKIHAEDNRHDLVIDTGCQTYAMFNVHEGFPIECRRHDRFNMSAMLWQLLLYLLAPLTPE